MRGYAVALAAVEDDEDDEDLDPPATGPVAGEDLGPACLPGPDIVESAAPVVLVQAAVRGWLARRRTQQRLAALGAVLAAVNMRSAEERQALEGPAWDWALVFRKGPQGFEYGVSDFVKRILMAEGLEVDRKEGSLGKLVYLRARAPEALMKREAERIGFKRELHPGAAVLAGREAADAEFNTSGRLRMSEPDMTSAVIPTLRSVRLQTGASDMAFNVLHSVGAGVEMVGAGGIVGDVVRPEPTLEQNTEQMCKPSSTACLPACLPARPSARPMLVY